MNEEQKTGRVFSSSATQPAVYLFFFLLLLIAYLPSFRAEWHFDDLPNILHNTPLHLTELSPASLKRTFFAYPESEGTLLRPVSNLSFALNWFLHQDKVFGYHLVNFFIHFLATVFLYKSCLLLLISPKVGNKYYESRYVIAALAALFWGLNPMQTQAVTYIVQRMASLAAMFTIIGIWCYLEARILSSVNQKKIIFYTGAFAAFLLALGSKENAILFPASIVLIELFFFREEIRISKQNILIILTGILFIFIFALLLKGPNIFKSLFSSSTDRVFTPIQRLLTQPRIILFYLSLLFYPAPFRLSLIHDIEISTSLFNPITTFFSLLCITSFIALPFFYHKRYPLLSFSILFFLLNHAVESTFLNLELIFEHRNYLPSFFLFFPVAAAIGTFIQHYRSHSRFLYFTMSATVVLLVLFLLVGTLTRNNVWLTEKSLWTDSLKKAPKSSGPYINLGNYYLLKSSNLHEAFKFYNLSLGKYSATPWKVKLWTYNNMGYVMKLRGNYEKALQFYEYALAESQDKIYGKYNAPTQAEKAQVLWRTGQKQEAVQIMSGLTLAKPESGKYLQQYGEMLIGLNRIEEGITALQQVFAHSDMTSEEYRKALLDFALLYARLDFMKKSAFYMRMADILGVPVVPSSLCFIEASLLANNKQENADQAMRLILSRITWFELIAIVEETSPNTPMLPLDYGLLRQYVADWISTQKNKLRLEQDNAR